MKRKIIKQGHNTLTVTLPSNWAKRFRLKQGEEIDVLERDNGLFLSTEKQFENLTAEIDISDLDVPSIWKYFMAVYREGYDEVKVMFKEGVYDNPYKFFAAHAVDIRYGKQSPKLSALEVVQQITSRFIGYEVIEHHRNYCIIKNMSEPSSKEFENSLRRVFLLIQQMADETLEAIKTNNHKMLCHTHDIDINVDKFHDYCIRVLNKTGFKEVRKANLLFSVLYILEILGDEFKNIAFHIVEDLRERNLESISQLCELTVNHLRTYYELFYKFSKEQVMKMSKQDAEIYFYLPKMYKKNGRMSNLTKDELEVFNHFRRITRYINALLELRIEMEF